MEIGKLGKRSLNTFMMWLSSIFQFFFFFLVMLDESLQNKLELKIQMVFSVAVFLLAGAAADLQSH